MGKKTKVHQIEFNYPAFDQIRRSGPVSADLNRRANAIARSAGEGFEVRTGSNPSRAWAVVTSTTADAARAEAEDKALTRAIDAGRG